MTAGRDGDVDGQEFADRVGRWPVVRIDCAREIVDEGTAHAELRQPTGDGRRDLVTGTSAVRPRRSRWVRR